MSRSHAQIDLRWPFYPAHDEEDGSEGEDDDYGGVEPHASRRHFETNDDAMGMLDVDEEVDLEGYEQYLAELKSKAEARPQSARMARTMPTESPQFYMVNAHNPSFPAAPPPANSRPTRPMSARPRLSSSSRTKSTSSSSAVAPVNQAPRALQLASQASIGVRRKRQQGGDDFVNARVRAIYHDTGHSAPVVKQMPSSVSATAMITNKLKIFQHVELHDEYYKLVDVVTELKTACQQEQERRAKAMSRIRRLEEIVTMKDRKIESLLHAKSVGSNHSHLVGAITQREMAQRDRQNNALLLKLKHKIAQQAQIISSYEEAMQSLRSGIKATNLMELEEERNQLYLELHNLQEFLGCTRLESESQVKKINELFQIEGDYRQQIAKLQQENKKCGHERQKCDQELAFLKSRINQLQEKLVHEQRKRAYDREVSSGDSGGGGSHLISPPRSSVLASALEEMKELMKKECMASIQREKLKPPRPGSSSKSPRYTAGVSTTTTSHAPVATPATAQPPLQWMARPQSAGPTHPHRTMASSSSSTTTTTTGKPSASSSSSSAGRSQPATSPKSSNTSTSDTSKQSDASDQQTGTNESEKIELREEEREEDSDQTSADASHDATTSGANQVAGREVVAQPHESLMNGETLMMPHPNKDVERRTSSSDAVPVDASAAEVNIVESKTAAPSISEAGDGKSEKEMNTVNDAQPPLDDHSRGSLASPQVHLEVNTTEAEGKSNDSVELDEEELQRRKIAEVSRLLQEMGDTDMDDPALLASDSSEEFLQVAEFQREQLDARVSLKSQEAVAAVDHKQEKSGLSPSSSSSSSSEAGSPLPHASLLHSIASEENQEVEETPSISAAPAEPSQESADADAAAAMTLKLQAIGHLKGSESQGSGVSASASGSGSAPSSGELIYDSDFTENEDEDENENENEGAEDLE